MSPRSQIERAYAQTRDELTVRGAPTAADGFPPVRADLTGELGWEVRRQVCPQCRVPARSAGRARCPCCTGQALMCPDAEQSRAQE